jgi:hypothetical protein
MNSKYKKYGCGGIFFTVILLFFSGMLIYSLFITTKSFIVYSWPQVEAEILFSKTESSSGIKNTTFRIVSEYEYEFESTRFTHNGLAVSYGFNDNIEKNGSIKHLLQEGAIVKAYVNPSDPQEAYLVAGLHHTIIFFFIFILMFGSLISFFVLPLLTNGRISMRKLLWVLIIIWASGIIYLVKRPLDISIADKIEIVEKKE